ncbi:MAG: hypothetical protein ACPGR7_04905 [Flavobacteriaceae bacterium]
MKNNIIFSYILLFASMAVMAQNKEKTYEETFRVNKEILVEVNSSFTDVIVETWNKNEVSVLAKMEIDSISEQEANELFDNWDFEAMGNSEKVMITSQAKGRYHGDNFIFISDGTEFSWVENFDISDIEIPDVVIPNIVIGELEIPQGVQDFQISSFDFDKYKMDSLYMKEWSASIKESSQRFKQEMEDFKNSEEFQMVLKEAEESWKETQEELAEQQVIIMKEMTAVKEEMQQAKIEMSKFKKELKKELDEEMKKSVQIKKTLLIKVPKGTKLNLKVKHGKLDLPDMEQEVVAEVSHSKMATGFFNSGQNQLALNNCSLNMNGLNGGSLNIKNSQSVEIGSLGNCEFNSNYSKVSIGQLGANVQINQKFGKIMLGGYSKEFNKAVITNEYGKLELNTDQALSFVYEGDQSKLKILTDGNVTYSKDEDNNSSVVKGYAKNPDSNKEVTIKNTYGYVSIK